jgi:hypothetical protein
MFNTKFLCAFVAVMFWVAGAHALFSTTQTSEASTLRMKFEQGQTFTLHNKFDIEGEADVPKQMLTEMGVLPAAADGSSIEGTSNATASGTFDFTWDVAVKEVRTDGSALLDVLLTKAYVTFDAQLADDSYNFESDLLKGDGQTPELPQDSRAVSIEVAPNGAILAANGEKIADSLNALVTQFEQQQIKITREQLENLSKMFINFYIRYPDTAVKTGDTWANQVDLSSLVPKGQQGELTVNQFQLLFAQDWKVNSKTDSTVDIKENSQTMPKFAIQFESKDATVTIDAAGQEAGSVQVNALTGLFNTIERDFEMAGKFIAQDKGETKQRWEIPFNFTVESKLSIEE